MDLSQLGHAAGAHPVYPQVEQPAYLHGDFEDPDNDELHSPLPPPASAFIPPIDDFGAHACGRHRHHQGLLDSFPRVSCDRCTRDPRHPGHMHVLACGHVVCRHCLDDAAINASMLIGSSARELDGYLEEARVADERRREAQLGLRSIGERSAAIVATCVRHFNAEFRHWDKNYQHWMRKANSRAGLMCCDQVMNLDAFVRCLSPMVATAFWVEWNWMRTPRASREFCGWPDCGRFLPPRGCTWMHRSDGRRRFRCMSCGGNSQSVVQMGSIPKRIVNVPAL